MNSSVKILSILLVVQLALTALVNTGGQNLEHFSSDEKVITSNLSDADKLQIVGEGKTVTLTKVGSNWQVADSAGFPADTKKIDGLLTTLANLKKTWPVAQTESALKPLKVDQSNFERKLVFNKADAQIAEVILGSSPSFKKVHGRLASDNTVYVWDMNSVDYPTSTADWQDKNFLSLKEEKLTSLKLNNLELVQKEKTWTLSDLAEGEKVNSTEVNALVSALANLKYTAVLDKQEPVEWKQQKESYSLQLGYDNVQQTYEFRGPLDKKEYYLKRTQDEFYFKVAEASVKRFSDITRDKLIQK